MGSSDDEMWKIAFIEHCDKLGGLNKCDGHSSGAGYTFTKILRWYIQ